MDRKKSCRSLPVLGWLLTILFLSLLTSNGHAANYALEIIQPQPNLNTLNRFYKAYPGLEYNVRLAVIGGQFPYRYKLTSGPEGMTIDRRGEVTWANPTEASTPYSVSVAVTDAESISRSVSWTIAVTTNGFYFIDAIKGTSASLGGTGSLNNPWKSMKDMYEGDAYESKTANSYAGGFLYWRNGTYAMEGNKEADGKRIPFIGNYKPLVWLAYPGESPVINMAAAYLAIYGGGTNTYFDGLEFNINSNSRGMGILIDSNASNVTFRRNKFHGITNGYGGGNNAFIFIARANVGNYYSIQDNEMSDVNEGYGVLGYSARNVLVEDNTLHQIRSHPISPKEGTARWFIRGNHMYNNPYNSINVQYASSNESQSGDIEISYNLVEAGGGTVRMNSNQTSSGRPVYIYRNTFLDEVNVLKVTSSNGPFYYYDNVIVNDTSYPDKMKRVYIDDPSRLILTNNLTGNSSENIVDTKGNLATDYSVYVGTRGYQIGNPPLPPIGFSVR